MSDFDQALLFVNFISFPLSLFPSSGALFPFFFTGTSVLVSRHKAQNNSPQKVIERLPTHRPFFLLISDTGASCYRYLLLHDLTA